ncbi:MAG: hypothetical protein QOE66_1290, partial [Chloroflexota bacterium]|nr:hypothetical protein [Chloroflexota bacterium]
DGDEDDDGPDGRAEPGPEPKAEPTPT